MKYKTGAVLPVAILVMLSLGGPLRAQQASPTVQILKGSSGFVAVPSRYDVQETTDRLTQALEANSNINLLGVIGHAGAAASVGLELAPTRVILFGNPALGTPLMQEVRTTAIDLPQKLLVWEADDGSTFVGYNTPGYLQSRHDLPNAESLRTIGGALANLAASVTADPEGYRNALAKQGTATATSSGGMITVRSTRDFEGTVSGLANALRERSFRVPFTVRHSQAAADKGLQLLPTTLFIFGNPNVGTPLMRSERRIAIDLPQKMLVWEDPDGAVQITYNDPAFLVERHSASQLSGRAGNIADALRDMASAAAGIAGR